MSRTPLFPAGFFSGNRQALVRNFNATDLIWLCGAEPMIRNADIPHPWRQDSSFFYFTGIDQPGCDLLLLPDGHGNHEEILFLTPVDPEKEKWNGSMLTREQATDLSGITKVQASETLLPTLFRTQKWRESLFCELNDHFHDQPLTRRHRLLQDIGLRIPGLQIRKLDPYSARLRLTKQQPEIEALRQSIAIIDSALRKVMQKLSVGCKEYQIEAELVYHYLHSGCRRQGFDAIVAGGGNAAVLHYTDNDDTLRDGDLVLIDTGGEYGMYSGDITRVYPVNGRFTPRQKECYQAVLQVNREVIAALKPGLTLKQLYQIADDIIGKIYTHHGFIQDPKQHLSVSYHRIGHFLGLDVHDVGSLTWPMTPGTVITIEPGLYLPDERLGIRIEDNVLFTADGIEVLTDGVPREIEEIEAIIAGR
jgi:Xaa-Pro aminopeptidase